MDNNILNDVNLSEILLNKKNFFILIFLCLNMRKINIINITLKKKDILEVETEKLSLKKKGRMETTKNIKKYDIDSNKDCTMKYYHLSVLFKVLI